MSERIWITGAGSGIGEALAIAIAGRGASVIASGRRAAPLKALEQRHPAISALPLDVTDAEAVTRAVAGMGRVDTAILCAGTYLPTPGQSFDAATVRGLMETNLMGTVHCVAALLPGMLARRAGRLVLVASVAGYRGLPTAAGYSASKAAVIALAESLKTDLEGSGLRVNLVNPGFVDTPLTRQNSFPMPDLISAEAAAATILRGLAGRRFEIAFPARFAAVMKLLRLLPDRAFFAVMNKVAGR
ncbi:MAG TPA: SDR family NAD(P)-dependent oxidoreductase [Rhodospirillaceae bacterium]|nr:SDR family NAD(P)-dependent oxidoreductase [Rhodospirillaceae bacterium]